MLILVFRGIFLLGILSWYSANVWKMIDSYFKERFDKYLQQEYEKNPKMRDHVDTYKKSTEDSGESVFHENDVKTKTTITPIDYQRGSCKSLDDLGEETCPIDASSVKKMAGDERTGSGSLLSTGGHTIEDAQPSESEVVGKGGAGKNIFAKSSIATSMSNVVNVPKDRSVESVFTPVTIKTISNDLNENVTSIMATADANSSKVVTRTPGDSANVESSKSNAKKTKIKSKLKARKPIRAKAAEEDKGKKKKRVKTIVFTEEDFREAKIRGGWEDYDFAEFDDYEDDTREPLEGILVSQLPFKPRADIGKLERVTDDEFCPLTLEDEANCDEIKTWP